MIFVGGIIIAWIGNCVTILHFLKLEFKTNSMFEAWFYLNNCVTISVATLSILDIDTMSLLQSQCFALSSFDAPVSNAGYF